MTACFEKFLFLILKTRKLVVIRVEKKESFVKVGPTPGSCYDEKNVWHSQE